MCLLKVGSTLIFWNIIHIVSPSLRTIKSPKSLIPWLVCSLPNVVSSYLEWCWPCFLSLKQTTSDLTRLWCRSTTTRSFPSRNEDLPQLMGCSHHGLFILNKGVPGPQNGMSQWPSSWMAWCDVCGCTGTRYMPPIVRTKARRLQNHDSQVVSLHPVLQEMHQVP